MGKLGEEEKVERNGSKERVVLDGDEAALMPSLKMRHHRDSCSS